jgi:hypothetical protein
MLAVTRIRYYTGACLPAMVGYRRPSSFGSSIVCRRVSFLVRRSLTVVVSSATVGVVDMVDYGWENGWLCVFRVLSHAIYVKMYR